MKESEQKILLKQVGKGNTGGGVTGNEARKMFREAEFISTQVYSIPLNTIHRP